MVVAYSTDGRVAYSGFLNGVPVGHSSLETTLEKSLSSLIRSGEQQVSVSVELLRVRDAGGKVIAKPFDDPAGNNTLRLTYSWGYGGTGRGDDAVSSAAVSPSQTPLPTATLTPTSTSTPQPTFTPTPSPTPSPTATLTPTSTSTPQPTFTPTPSPTATLTPTSTPTGTPTPTPTVPPPTVPPVTDQGPTSTPIPTPTVPPEITTASLGVPNIGYYAIAAGGFALLGIAGVTRKRTINDDTPEA